MKKHFISINTRFITLLALCTIAPMLIFSFYFYSYERSRALEQYRRESEINMSVAIKNIEYYISTCVSSARTVYSNPDLHNMLLKGSPQDFVSQEFTEPGRIFSYMQGIYTVAPNARQIRLLSFRLNKSFLLITNTLQKSMISLNAAEAERPTFSEYTDVTIEPVHPMSTYGHRTYYSSGSLDTEEVFTIWLPIYSISAEKQLLGVLSIDMPATFIYDNCCLAYKEGEFVCIVNSDGEMILSGSPQSGDILFSSPIVKKLLAPGYDTFHSFTEDGVLYLKSSFPASYLDWHMIKAAPDASIYSSTDLQLRFLTTTFLLGVLLATVLNSLTLTRLTGPLKKATRYLTKAKGKSGDFSKFQLSDYLGYRQNDELKMLFDSMQEMMDSIQHYTIRQYKMELLQQDTELKMLQAQINPHFIHNTLQCLANNALANNDLAQYDYITALGQMMRYAMEISQTVSSLGEELDYVYRYFTLQKMRFCSIAEFKICPVYPRLFLLPKMTLQPLIENCIYHGGVMKKTDGLSNLQQKPKGIFSFSLFATMGSRLRQNGRWRCKRAFPCKRTGLWNAMPSLRRPPTTVPWRSVITRTEFPENILASTMFLCACFFTLGQTAPSRSSLTTMAVPPFGLSSPASRRSPHPTQFIFSSYRGGMIYEGTDCGR